MSDKYTPKPTNLWSPVEISDFSVISKEGDLEKAVKPNKIHGKEFSVIQTLNAMYITKAAENRSQYNPGIEGPTKIYNETD